MEFDRFLAAAQDPLLIVPSGITEARWEALWLERHGLRKRGAARRPPVTTPARLIAACWDTIQAAADAPFLISEIQATAIWRQVVANSSEGPSLISLDHAARSAQSAWQMLHHSNISWQALRASNAETDFAVFLRWCRSYSERLATERWIDATSALERIATTSISGQYAIGIASWDVLPPAWEGALTALSQKGNWHRIEANVSASETYLARASDPDAELLAVGNWLATKTRIHPSECWAVVIPDVRARSVEILSVLGDSVREAFIEAGREVGPNPVWLASGAPTTDCQPVGAALNALELLFGAGSFGNLSRWLRSPFFEAPDLESPGQRALFEAGLRNNLLAQWNFRDAIQRGGLASKMRLSLPVATRDLERALQKFDTLPRRASPSEWVAVWEACLRDLHWRPDHEGATSSPLQAWERSLQGFASLSPILNGIDRIQAIDEFRRILANNVVRRAMPLSGVHVFERIEDVGPGYRGVWIMEFTDTRWPSGVRLNSFLPQQLQVALGVPFATPALAASSSTEEFVRLRSRVPEVVCSIPDRISDVATQPSRLLAGIAIERLPASRASQAGSYYLNRLSSREKRLIPDSTPAIDPSELAGGIRLLDVQSACPLRAFCEFRLGAKALEIPRRGITAQTRGIVVHRALELLLEPAVRNGPVNFAGLRAHIVPAVRRALSESIDWPHPPWDLMLGLEAERCARTLNALIDKVEGQAQVEIDAVETRIELTINRWRLSGRVDRIDRLPDGGLLIFDYKTGAASPSSAWFTERLKSTQLPAYAVAYSERIRGFSVVNLGDGSAEFRGVGDFPMESPVAARPKLAGAAWAAQLQRWSEQIESLLAEYAAGDARIFVADSTLAEGAFAPLTRVFALRAAGSISDV
jgi:ATP-dependent helicase/nuclease subunit B